MSNYREIWENLGSVKCQISERKKNQLIKYDRLQGVPQGHYMLMKIICFGEMGGPYYSDQILYHSGEIDVLIEYCKSNNIELDHPAGWNEYFITKNNK